MTPNLSIERTCPGKSVPPLMSNVEAVQKVPVDVSETRT